MVIWQSNWVERQEKSKGENYSTPIQVATGEWISPGCLLWGDSHGWTPQIHVVDSNCTEAIPYLPDPITRGRKPRKVVPEGSHVQPRKPNAATRTYITRRTCHKKSCQFRPDGSITQFHLYRRWCVFSWKAIDSWIAVYQYSALCVMLCV